MSHSQFRCIILILRHAWLSLQVKHMLLAGSTSLLPSFHGSRPIKAIIGLLIPFGCASAIRRQLPSHCQYYLQLTSSTCSTGRPRSGRFRMLGFFVGPSEGAITTQTGRYLRFLYCRQYRSDIDTITRWVRPSSRP